MWPRQWFVTSDVVWPWLRCASLCDLSLMVWPRQKRMLAKCCGQGKADCLPPWPFDVTHLPGCAIFYWGYLVFLCVCCVPGHEVWSWLCSLTWAMYWLNHMVLTEPYNARVMLCDMSPSPDHLLWPGQCGVAQIMQCGSGCIVCVSSPAVWSHFVLQLRCFKKNNHFFRTTAS